MQKYAFTVLMTGLLLCGVAGSFPNHEEAAYPAYFPEPVYPLGKAHQAQTQITLGRVLFYDPILSRDGSISCASCHSPFNAFAHSDHELSHGIDDQIGIRNAPPLFNLAWQTNFMWDGAITDLATQALVPIQHKKEMDASLQQVLRKLNASVLYRGLFAEAFGDSLANEGRLLQAITQFQIRLISDNAKYDQVQKGAASFTEQEQKGYQVFLRSCNSCHTEPLFSSYQLANNGLPVDATLMDPGKAGVSHRASDSLLFKIPSLRNLSFSAPYMHDGRFAKLREVIQHYTEGIQSSPTLAPELQTPVQLTDHEKIDLIAFLLTLDDRSFVFQADFQFPIDILR